MIAAIGTVVTILGVAGAAAVVVVAILDARTADKAAANRDVLPVVKTVARLDQRASGVALRKYEVKGFAGFYQTVRRDDMSSDIRFGELLTIAHDGNASS
jgi:hypothetical protein